MMLYLNMASEVVLDTILMRNVSRFVIDENIGEMSNTAKITIAKANVLNEKPVLDYFKVGGAVRLSAGYYRDGFEDMAVEFTGYIREIESDFPLVVHCDDDTYPLRQGNKTMSWRSVWLDEVLKYILPEDIGFECPDITLGRFQVDNESPFQTLQRIKSDYGLYSRLKGGVLSVNLRDLTRGSDVKNTHTYVLNPREANSGPLVKKNELKFKRKEDYKLHVKVTSIDGTGKKISVDVGNRDKGASLLQFTYPGTYTEEQLRTIATSIYNNRCYDGYSGSITGFGLPRTHAGDALVIDDQLEPERSGRYLIEKVAISYDEDTGFSRKNTLSYLIADNAQKRGDF